MIEYIGFGIAGVSVVGTGFYWLKDRNDQRKKGVDSRLQHIETDVAVMKNDVSWIKDHLKNGNNDK